MINKILACKEPINTSRIFLLEMADDASSLYCYIRDRNLKGCKQVMSQIRSLFEHSSNTGIPPHHASYRFIVADILTVIELLYPEMKLNREAYNICRAETIHLLQELDMIEKNEKVGNKAFEDASNFIRNKEFSTD